MSVNAPIGGDVPIWTLGNRLWRARTHLGVTQQELAHRLGVGVRAIKEGESDKKAPRRATILGWAVACGVDPRWLETGHYAPRDNGPDLGSTHSGCNEITPLRPRRPRETATYRAPTRRAS